jgi:uncharacterized protein
VSAVQVSGRFALPGIVLVLSAGCGGATAKAPTPATTPVVSGPRAILPSGNVYRLELARTPEEQAQGLMFRESLPPNTGMLFVFDVAGPHRFWMKNTMIPLDMIWLDEAGRVTFVSADTPPCKADPCPNYGPDTPAARVLEIAGGMAAKEKVTIGSVIQVEGVSK